MAGRIEGKVAIITGSTSGIGRASAELFAREGAKVVVSGRRKALGEEVVAGIREAGGTASFFEVDITDDERLKALIDYAVDTYGRLDVLMNNAYGGIGGGSAVDCPPEAWDYGMSVGLRAVFMGCKFAIPHMIEGGGGSIIITSSVHGILASKRGLPYEPLKAALIHLGEQLAVDYGAQRIRCNTICPGLIIVEKMQPLYDKFPRIADWHNIQQPLGPWGTPMDIAYPALFLASDEAAFVSGATLVVDGALTRQLQESALNSMRTALVDGDIDLEDLRAVEQEMQERRRRRTAAAAQAKES